MRTRLQMPRAGFTLIEISISVLVLAVMMGIFGMVSATSNSAYQATAVTTGLDVNARRTLTRIASELAPIGGSVLAPDPTGNFGAQTMQYQRAAGVVAGAVVWGQNSQIGFEYSDGEVDDGIDNNNNGLVDEGVVVMTLDVGGLNPQRVVLCHDVRELAAGEVANGVDDNGNGVADEAGFNIQRVGDVMTIRICLERRAAGEGTVSRTHQTSVRLRNIDL